MLILINEWDQPVRNKPTVLIPRLAIFLTARMVIAQVPVDCTTLTCVSARRMPARNYNPPQPSHTSNSRGTGVCIKSSTHLMMSTEGPTLIFKPSIDTGAHLEALQSRWHRSREWDAGNRKVNTMPTCANQQIAF